MLLTEFAMKKVKTWLSENGFVGATALIVAVAALFLGMMFVFWGSIGFFVGKNWEIIRKLWKEEYKDKVEDLIDDIKK